MFQDICCIVQGLSVTDIADIACIAHNIPTLRFAPPYIKSRTKHRKRQTYTFILSPLLFVPLTKSHIQAGFLLGRGVFIEGGIANTRTWNYLNLEHTYMAEIQIFTKSRSDMVRYACIAALLGILGGKR